MTPDQLSEVLLAYVILPAGINAVVVGLMFPNQRFYDVVADLEVVVPLVHGALRLRGLRPACERCLQVKSRIAGSDLRRN